MEAGWDLAAFWPEFVAEVQSNLERLEKGLLRLEEGDTSAVAELFRAAHTIKGAARMMGLEALAEAAAQMETLFEALRGREPPVDAETLQTGWQLVDAIRAELNKAAPGGTARPEEATASPGEASTTTDASGAGGKETPSHELVAVRSDLLENLIAAGTALHLHYLRLESLYNTFERRWRELRRGLMEADALPPDRQRALDGWAQSLQDYLAAFRVALSQLEETALGLRLVPFGLLRTPILRLVRDAARQLGKEVTCEIQGEETLIDRKLVQPLQDVLTHLLRNAVDHGIERPEERERAGKSRQGRITVKAYLAHPQVVVEVADDGRGIDPQAVVRAAVARGVVSQEEASRLSPQAALQLIFSPGFSTRTEVGTYSGRGVGLDVVATTVRRWGGTVEVESAPGQGTRFILRWPLNLSLAEILVVRAGRWTFGIPRGHVETVLAAQEAHFVDAADVEHLLWRDQLVPCWPLSRWFPTEAAGSHIVLVRARQQRVALTGASVTGLQELLLQPVPPLLAQAEGVQAVALLGNGIPIAILDVDRLSRATGVQVRTHSAEARAQPRQPAARAPILVVDDMFLTRDLLRSVLSAAGYSVITAESAEEAIARLPQLQELAAVITDVHMPGMDGIALTRFLRAHPRWKDLPVIILSGDGDPATVQAGLEAGATAYLTKKDFTQGTLLEIVERAL